MRRAAAPAAYVAANYGCADNGCVFGHVAGGMGTNGGCQCIDKHITSAERRRLKAGIHALRNGLAEQEARIAHLVDERDALLLALSSVEGAAARARHMMEYFENDPDRCMQEGHGHGSVLEQEVCNVVKASDDAHEREENLRHAIRNPCAHCGAFNLAGQEHRPGCPVPVRAKNGLPSLE